MSHRIVLAALVFACSRATATHDEALAKKKSPESPEKAPAPKQPVSPPSAAPSSEPPPVVESDDGKRKLEPFLAVIEPKIPAGAYARAAAAGVAKKPLDPLKAKGAVTLFPDSTEVKVIDLELGASSFGWAIAVLRAGKVVTLYDDVMHYALDPAGGHLALDHHRPEAGKRVRAREIVDLATLSLAPLPAMPCTQSLRFVDGGTRLLGWGFELEKPGEPHAYICVFDGAGKLLIQIDADRHFHHAASIDFINWHVGVLPKDAAVVYATREYRSYGNYDLMLIDTRTPHARRLARLTTPNMQPSNPGNVELDLAETTLSSNEVRFRGKSPEGWFWKWQTKPLAEVSP